MLLSRSLLFTLATLSTALVAEDFGPAVKVAGLAFPDKTHYGVVCHYDRSRDAVNDLLRALPDGTTLTVLDARHPEQIGAAATVIAQRGVQMLALLPADTLVRDGSPFATQLVNLLKTFKSEIPSFGTTSAALKNGCTFALGQETNWKILINGDPRLKGVIENITLEEIRPTGMAAHKTPANLWVVSMGR